MTLYLEYLNFYLNPEYPTVEILTLSFFFLPLSREFGSVPSSGNFSGLNGYQLRFFYSKIL